MPLQRILQEYVVVEGEEVDVEIRTAYEENKTVMYVRSSLFRCIRVTQQQTLQRFTGRESSGFLLSTMNTL
jgi:hypothetical protein